MELQQSPQYARFVKLLGWQVEHVDGVNIFYRSIPLMGVLAKIQRNTKLPSVSAIKTFLAKQRVRSLSVEPAHHVDQQEFSRWLGKIKKVVKIYTSPFLPTKTISIDLTASRDEIFQRLSEAKRRAVRRAQKNNVTVRRSDQISDLIAIKNKSAGLFGFITTHGTKELWHVLGLEHTAILIAYSEKKKPIGGVYLIFWNRIAYYWIAGATREGKKLFAPSLLVWEALKLAKERGAKRFDFIGVWDERLPRQNNSWKGFTKFKEGFGGNVLYYPIATLRK